MLAHSDATTRSRRNKPQFTILAAHVFRVIVCQSKLHGESFVKTNLDQLISGITSSLANKEYKFTHAEYVDRSEQTRPVFSNIVAQKNDVNITVVYGDNAAGKSLVSKLLAIKVTDNNIPCRVVSMKNRTSSGIERALIFGSEKTDSTGATSARITMLSLDSAIDDKRESFVILDEPDIGLSSKYCKAMGHLISNKSRELSEFGGHVLLITHSKELIKSFMHHHGCCPSYIGMDTDLTLEEWLNDDEMATIDELLELKSIGARKKRALSKHFNN